MGKFHARLWYSIGNEDWKTEQAALKIQPDSNVLCVTASGDRPLNLLTVPCASMTTVDANPFQNALFDLKKAAMQQLSYQEYLAFLGILPHPDRIKTYNRLKQTLNSASINLWKKHSKKIAAGVIYQGMLERFLKRVSSALHLIRGKKIKRLFACNDLVQQQIFLENDWKTFLCRKALHVALHPTISRTFIKDPGLYAHVDSSTHAGQKMFERIHASLNGFLAKESLLLNLFFNGKIAPEQFPPYLNEAGVGLIKPHLDNVHFETLDLVSFLEQAKSNSYDRFSISDVASYLSKEDFHRLLKELYRTAKPGARFCIRQFLSEYHLPEPYASSMKREPALEQTLEREDRCCVYKFMVGTIEK